jgi:hypothetical protein
MGDENSHKTGYLNLYNLYKNGLLLGFRSLAGNAETELNLESKGSSNKTGN